MSAVNRVAGSRDTNSQGGIVDDYPGSKSYTWYLLAMLMVLMVFGQMDRMVIATLFPQLKEEWGLSDTDLGLLAAATYWSMALFVIPAAVMTDRWSRTKAISLMATVWTVATVACGMAANFLQLFMARFFIGAGEGGYNAGAVSMIAGMFPSRLRTTATSLFVASGTIGSLIGLALGGYVAARWGWRYAFFAVALPGFLVVLVFMVTAKDFRTIALEVYDQAGVQRKLKWNELLRALFATPSLVCLYFGISGVLFVNASILSWAPSLFSRVEGLPTDQAALRSSFLLVAAAFGAILGGMAVDRWKQRSLKMAMRGPAAFALLSSVGFALGLTQLEGADRMSALLVGAFFMSASMGPIIAASQTVIHPGLRATTVGIINVIGQIFGGSGAILTGVLSESFGLAVALTWISLALPLAAVVLFAGASRYEIDADRVPRIEIRMKD